MRRAASRERRSLAIILLPLIVAAAVFATTPVLGYLKLGTRVGSRTVNIKWNDLPIRYYVTERGTTGVTAQQFQTAISTSFGVWDAVDSADLSAEFAGFTAANPLSGDSMTVIGYQNRPDLDRVLAATNFIIDTQSGEVVESDISSTRRSPGRLMPPARRDATTCSRSPSTRSAICWGSATRPSARTSSSPADGACSARKRHVSHRLRRRQHP